jgi:tRNA(Ile)-lysidine synthase
MGPVDDLLARCPFPDPDHGPVSCGVSGGADSLALLLLARHAGLEVTAVHVDHGLRPGSAAEADVVADVAQRVGAGFRAVQAVVEPGSNLEARARAARYAALPPDVLTGHTADDQAETVLLNLMRGSGLDGLAGMHHGARRPLLGVRRSETVALCAAAGFVPVDDPSNRDPRFRRNRVRHELLPLMDAIAERDVVPVLARQARILGADAELLASLAATVDPTDASALRGESPSVARAAVRAWLRPALGGRPPDAATVQRVLDVAAGEAVATDVGTGLRVARTAGRLRLEPAATLPA